MKLERTRGLCIQSCAVFLLVLSSRAGAVPQAVIAGDKHIEAGEVEPGQVLHYSFALRNDGDATLAIKDLAPTCYCTSVNTDLWDIPPGKTATIKVRIDPSDFVGPISKGVEILTNDPKNPELLVDVDLTVRPGIAVMPPELDFGRVAASGSKSLQVDIKAPRAREFEVLEVAADADFLEIATEPLSLEDRHGAMLFVKVLPGAPRGSFEATITAKTSDPSRATITIPVHGQGPGGLTARPERLTFAVTPAGADAGTVDITGGGPIEVRSTSDQLLTRVEELEQGRYRVHVQVAEEARAGRVLAKLVVSTPGENEPSLEVPVMGIVR